MRTKLICALFVLATVTFASCKKDETLSLRSRMKGVYVAGCRFNGQNRIAKTWTNGTTTNLTDRMRSANAYSVFVVD